jgi:hypothetical protein
MIYSNSDKTISQIALFCCNLFSLDEQEIIIDIFITDLSEDSELAQCVVTGWCYFDEDIFHIEIEEKLDFKEQATTLCHEMIHIRQISNGFSTNEEQALDLESVVFDFWSKENKKYDFIPMEQKIVSKSTLTKVEENIKQRANAQG